MDIKEAKKIIFKWLREKGFKRIIIPGSGPFDYVHSLDEFSVLISFSFIWQASYSLITRPDASSRFPVFFSFP